MDKSLSEKAFLLSMIGDFDPQKLPGNTVVLWQLVSRALLLRAEGYCEVCGKKNQKTHVHHKDGCGLNNALDNLIVMCASCHEKIHHPAFDLNFLPKTVTGAMVGLSTRKRTMQV